MVVRRSFPLAKEKVMENINFEGKNYLMVDGYIVDGRTNIHVCSELANKICQEFGFVVKKEVNVRERGDVTFLNSLIKNRVKPVEKV